MRQDGYPQEGKPSAERRYLSFVFVDMVGFTRLSEQLDPEDLMSVQHRYQNLSLTVAERFGGFVGNYLGDGVLIYFGYPTAHGNDAERAVRAGLELVAQLRTLQFVLRDGGRVQVQARVGVNTGLAIVGRELMSAGGQLHGAVGAAVNLAARLQQLAEPDEVVVSEQTRELIEDIFEFAPLAPTLLKGIASPVQPYSAVRLKRETGPAVNRRAAATMFGRALQLDRLLAEWRLTCALGQARVVEVVGEAGIGKTRLVSEVGLNPALTGAPVIRARCLELFAQSPLYALTRYLWGRTSLAEQDNDDVRRRKLDVFLAEIGLSSPENSRTLASFPGLLATLGEPIGPTPLLVKRKQMELIVKTFESSGAAHPAVLWIEDAHWLDPTSAEFLREIVVARKSAPLLVILTRREFPKGVELPRVDATISLSPLEREDCLKLAQHLAGDDPTARERIERVADTAEGNPLFLEHLIRFSRDDDAPLAKRNPQKVALPLVLAEMMSERLDRQQGGRQFAQAAACLGRSFKPDLLAVLMKTPVSWLDEPLAALVEAEVLVPRRHGGEIAYEFRHALLQQMARDSMLEADRVAIHARIARFLGEGGEPLALPEMRAYHLTEANQFPEAVREWTLAGVRAAKQSGHLEAINHFRKGLALLDRIEDVRVRIDFEIRLQAALFSSITSTQGATSLAISACCARGLELCEQLGPNPMLFPFLFGQFTFANCRGETDEAQSLADSLLTHSEAMNFDPGRVLAHRLNGMLRLGAGDAHGARVELERSLAYCPPGRDANEASLFGQDTRVHAQSLLSLTLLCLGDVDKALQCGREALKAADELRHPHSTAIALAYVGGTVFGYCGAVDLLLAHARRLETLAARHNISIFGAHGKAFVGWALAQRGDLEEGIALQEQAISAFDSMDYVIAVGGHLTNLAESQMLAGRFAEAKATVARAIRLGRKGASLWGQFETSRVEALIDFKLRPDAPEQAVVSLRRAAALAKEAGSPVFERRCLVSLQSLPPLWRAPPFELRLQELDYLADLPTRIASAMSEAKSAFA